MDGTALKWLELQRNLLRQASSKADQAARLWRERDADITNTARASGWDDIKRKAARDADTELSELEQEYAWWSGETTRRAVTIVGYVLASQAIEALKTELRAGK